ncbi:hypothetical protein EYF80_064963 [Liparis tanakae]|uniref:Uncharacterized protein n=1 Tax=Liparis tanakae TaxID=230148 RepID=A0A4Z2E823_9TELE|nr:hypothetical protein EYF80_064963 [Liparis tanakae]
MIYDLSLFKYLSNHRFGKKRLESLEFIMIYIYFTHFL